MCKIPGIQNGLSSFKGFDKDFRVCYHGHLQWSIQAGFESNSEVGVRQFVLLDW